MENCLYQGKTICTFDLKDVNGIYYEDMVLEWKQAAADRQLTCTECGAHVYLAAGLVKEPYFAHYDLEKCEYASGNESEELKKGKRLLYQLMKRSFPDGEIYARYHMKNGMYSTIYGCLSNGREIAIDLRLQNNSLDQFRNRASFYQENNILPIYVMGNGKNNNTKQIDWYQSLIQSAMGYLIFLDAKAETITLKRSFSYRLGKDRKFKFCTKTYPIKEIFMDFEGRICCAFWEDCENIEIQITREKEQYEKIREQKNKLRGFYEEMQQKEKDGMENYRKIEQEKSKSKQRENSSTIKVAQSLDPVIYEKCKKMIEEGNAQLVSKKYYDAIMKIYNS